MRLIDGDALFCKFWSLADPFAKQDRVFSSQVWNQAATITREAPTIIPSDWVSVDDRLPDVGDLVVYADRIAWGYQYGIRRISRDDRVFRKERSFYFWMPLPEPTDKGDEQ